MVLDFQKIITKNSMGFDLIYGLSEQINGNVNINCTNGTEISIEFKDSK